LKPTESLIHEHEIVYLVLDAIGREVEKIVGLRKADFEVIRKIVDFSRNFTDRCHHAKEENHLFSALEKRGLSRDEGPIAVMLWEHAQGREKIKIIVETLAYAEKGNGIALGVLRENQDAYAQLLRAHISKENNVLFPLADKLLTPEDQKALEEAFEKVEAEEMGAGTHELYHQLAHDLAKKPGS
jgi:hemerythrin-like domain-containing protein